MIQRIKDWRLERRIHRLSRQCAEAMKAGDKVAARAFWQAQGDAIRSRSPAQVKRMERRMGLR